LHLSLLHHVKLLGELWGRSRLALPFGFRILLFFRLALLVGFRLLGKPPFTLFVHLDEFQELFLVLEFLRALLFSY